MAKFSGTLFNVSLLELLRGRTSDDVAPLQQKDMWIGRDATYATMVSTQGCSFTLFPTVPITVRIVNESKPPKIQPAIVRKLHNMINTCCTQRLRTLARIFDNGSSTFLKQKS